MLFAKVAGSVLAFVACATMPAFAAHHGGRAAHHRRPAPGPAAPAIFVDGHAVRVDSISEGRRLLVPVRGVFERLHASVDYTPPHFVIVHKDGAVIAGLIIGRRHAIVNEAPRDLDVAPARRGSRIYVPLRLVSEAAGARVAYDGRARVVRIDSASPPAAPAAPSAVAAAAGAPAAAASGADRAGTPAWIYVVIGLFVVGLIAELARRLFAPQLGIGGAEAASAEPPSAGGPAPLPVRTERAAPPAQRDEAADPGELTIPLRSESLHIDTAAVLSGEAKIRKEVITEMRTIEVPVTREELVIEYAGTGGTVVVDGRALTDGEVVRIPLREEQIDVSKRTVLKEDVVIGRRRVSDVKTVSERPRHEVLRVRDEAPAPSAS